MYQVAVLEGCSTLLRSYDELQVQDLQATS